MCREIHNNHCMYFMSKFIRVRIWYSQEKTTQQKVVVENNTVVELGNAPTLSHYDAASSCGLLGWENINSV